MIKATKMNTLIVDDSLTGTLDRIAAFLEYVATIEAESSVGLGERLLTVYASASA